MREIKFRFYDFKITKQMIYQQPNKAKNVIFDKWETAPKCSPLMQYTGLKDKNDKEIYEGDIVTWLDKPIFSDSEKFEIIKDVIVYEDGCFRTKRYNELLSNLARTEKSGFKFNYLSHHETEVIGNIYEHPHLLEQVDEN